MRDALRHAITQGDFAHQDSEVVSGVALGTLGAVVRSSVSGGPAGAITGAWLFVGGCTLHHARRYWLDWRLRNGYF